MYDALVLPQWRTSGRHLRGSPPAFDRAKPGLVQRERRARRQSEVQA